MAWGLLRPRSPLLLTLCLLLAASLAAAQPVAEESSAAGRLRFRAAGADGGAPRLRVAQFTDLHYDGDTEAGNDAKTSKVQAAILAAEQPDLVVYSGDMVSGFSCPEPCPPGWFAQRWADVTAPVRNASIPYAIILGNHDAEADLNRRQIVALDERTGAPLALARQGPPGTTGASNYWVDVWEPAGASIAARIWLLDSMSRGCNASDANTTKGWGCVAADTLAWVEATAAELPPVPTSLAYVHIPIPQYMAVWNDAATAGSKKEDVSCPALDSGLFGLAHRVGIQAIWCGHNHLDDFTGVLSGVRLGFGRKTGYGSYGPPKHWQHGARIVELVLGASAAEARTWIAQEGGTRLFQVPTPEPKRGKQQRCDGIEDSSGGWSAGPTAALLAGLVAAAAVAVAALVLLGRRARRRVASRAPSCDPLV